ncbi:MAG: phage portal protein [Frankiales bacterium]|nr:phage portal protein [Frankiales bacterium]
MTLTTQLPRIPVEADPKQLSPGWWLQKLDSALVAKQPRIATLNAYADGEAPLMEVKVADSVKDAFREFQRRSRTTWADLIVDVMLDKIRVAAIRTGANGDEYGDDQAWAWWQANQLDADSRALHRSVFVTGEAFVIVGQVDPEIDAPVTTIEDPASIAIATDPLRRRTLRAALKRFVDEWTGVDHAYLYLRGENGAHATVYRGAATSDGTWQWIGDQPQTLPFSRVPVVWFPNLLSTNGKRSFGEFEKHIDLIDRINSDVMQRMVITAMQAARQRVMHNLPTHDKNNQPIDYDGVFAADPAAIWNVPKDVDVQELAATEPAGLLQTARDDIKDLSAVTRTPLPALIQDAANQTGENARMIEGGQNHKCADRIASLSEGWEEVALLQFLWAGDLERAKATDMEILWNPLEVPSMAERFDAASKAQAAGVNQSYIQREILGMSPQAIKRALANVPDLPPDPAGDARNLSLAEVVQKVYLGVGTMITSEEARAIVNAAGAQLAIPGPDFTAG